MGIDWMCMVRCWVKQSREKSIDFKMFLEFRWICLKAKPIKKTTRSQGVMFLAQKLDDVPKDAGD
jgi:hypothetical protein